MKDYIFNEKVGFAPSDWKIEKLRHNGEFYSGGTPSTTVETYWDGVIVWLVPSDLTALSDSQIYIRDSETKITEAGLRSCSAKMVPKGTVCMSSRATLGEAVIADVELCTNQGFVNVVPYPHFSALYFLYWVKQNKNYISRYAAGTTFLEISRRTLKNLFFAAPKDAEEQNAIAGILSKVDEAIQAVRDSIAAAEKFKKALMQNLLTGKLKPDGTWRSEDEFYEDPKMGRVPDSWSIKSIDQLFDFFPTASYSRSQLISEGAIGYVHYGDIHTEFDRILDLKTNRTPFIPNELEKKYEKVRDGDLIVSDASEDWEGVGKSVEVLNANVQPTICGLHTLHLRPIGQDMILGIKGYILNTYAASHAIKRMATGAKVYGVSKSSLKKVTLLVPPRNEQVEIKEVLDFFSNQILDRRLKIQTLERLKKSLMQNLLTGKKRVDVEKINHLLNQS